MQGKIQRQVEKACWNCKNRTFRKKEDGRIAKGYCTAKNDWFPDGWNFELNRDQGAETDCKRWR